MRRFFYFKPLTVIFAVTLLTFLSCEKEATNEVLDQNFEVYTSTSVDKEAITNDVFADQPNLKCYQQREVCGEYQFFPLIAGKWHYAGAIMVYNDSENLYVNFWGWGITETHLFVGALDDIPLNPHGVPAPGQFPKDYEVHKWGMVTGYVIPLDELPDCYIIAAHAATWCGETAWAKDYFNPLSFKEVFGVKRWGWIVQDCAEQCDDVEKVVALKTWFINTETNERFWGTVAYSDDCYVGVIDAEEGEYDLFDYYDNVIGTLTTSVEGENYKIVIEALNEVNYTIRSHVFYGTEQELNSYMVDGCYDYKSFPIFKEEALPMHEFVVPL